ncbi:MULTISPECIES: SpoIIE family protein phosphatase [Streptomyces]|uniref:SpoIIE family protein phosphatase n=1 Tax=Streptomyces TaxID=1883 RepID=UPI0019C10979|nr:MULTISPECIES: SpoIIE family protein phosphatase [Streptomyces]GGT20938.1 transcription antitermination regulator [Streptomyces toxytricini]
MPAHDSDRGAADGERVTGSLGAAATDREGPGTAMSVPRSGLASAVAELTAEVSALHAERARRRLIDLASGVLAGQLALSPVEATDHLLRLAGSMGLSAVDLAADIVNAAAGTHVSDGPAQTAGRGAHEAVPAAEARRIRRGIAATVTSDTAAAAATALLENGLHRLGVEAVYLWRRTPTACLELAGEAGADPQEAAHWHWIPPEAGGPLHRVLSAGKADWLPSGPDPGERLPGGRPDAARALLPLELDGRTVGVALAVWPGPAPLDPAARDTVAALCAPAAHHLDAADTGRGVPPQLASLLAQLDHPGVVICPTAGDGPPAAAGLPAHTVDYLNPAALRELGAFPSAAGRPAAQLYPSVHDELVGLIARANAAGAPQYAPVLPGPGPDAAPEGEAPRPEMAEVRVLPLGGGRAAVLWRTGSPHGAPLARALNRIDRLAAFEDDASGGSVWGPAAYAVFGLDPDRPPLPLRSLGRRLHPDDTVVLDGLLASITDRHKGAHCLVRVYRPDGGVRHVRIAAEPVLAGSALVGIVGVYQDVSVQHHTELALTATFEQLSAAQAEAVLRDQLVLRLQQAIVPEAPSLETPPGLRVAARYRPAAVEDRVGGDWYDVHPLPGGRVLVTVGDIAGHGIGAATAMIALRGALHGLAFTGAPPEQLMGWLNDVALGTPGQPTATAVCALFDPADRTLEWAGAGHPPPLLLRSGRARFLDGSQNVLLGALPGAAYEGRSTQLEAGDTLLLYTDGFIERRHTGLDESLASLQVAAERLRPGLVEDQADQLMGAAEGDTEDDTSLVVVQVS